MRSTCILVVDDDRDLVRAVTLGLEQAGRRVLGAHDAANALTVLARGRPDLVVLDVNMPGRNGLDLCRDIRSRSQVPLIFLTGRAREVDRVVGLRLGADDYMAKPFSTDELDARIEAVLRRTARGPETPALVQLGGLEIDLARHEVRVRGKAAPLTAKEYQLLDQLVRADGKVLTREALLQSIWSYTPDMDVDTRTLDQLVARLRRKLGPERGRLVTAAGYGYRLKTA